MSREDKRSISRILSRLTEVFERAGIETPRLDAEVLVAWCLGKERADLYRDLNTELENDRIMKILEAAGRRKRREPMAYIRGFREFWNFTFTVTPAVLVPRPETEILVEEVLALKDSLPGPVRILDIGAGSGAVGISLSAEWPEAEVTATEISAAALEVARQNAAAILAPGRMKLVRGDLYEGTEGLFDIVCSNPPYVSEGEYEELAREVRCYEPREALVPGPLGTEVHRRIIEGAPAHLKPGGWLLMEMGAEQRGPLTAIFDESGKFDSPRFRADYAGLDRVVMARRAGQDHRQESS